MIYSDILKVLEKAGGDGRHQSGLCFEDRKHCGSVNLQGKQPPGSSVGPQLERWYWKSRDWPLHRTHTTVLM